MTFACKRNSAVKYCFVGARTAADCRGQTIRIQDLKQKPTFSLYRSVYVSLDKSSVIRVISVELVSSGMKSKNNYLDNIFFLKFNPVKIKERFVSLFLFVKRCSQSNILLVKKN